MVYAWYMHAYRSMRIINDLHCAVEFISMIKASRLITIKGENRSQTWSTSGISAIEASVYYYFEDLLSHAQAQAQLHPVELTEHLPHTLILHGCRPFPPVSYYFNVVYDMSFFRSMVTLTIITY